MMDPNGGRAGGGLGHGGLDEHRMLYQDSRATGSALSGLSQKQGQIYKERKYRFRAVAALTVLAPSLNSLELRGPFQLLSNFFLL